ncbi:PREDICTED: charged multivesicular body protein 2b-like, partial [Amphimedon queenslandica]|uniref:Uncharacterized protein n=1 Tax=Amphimedon queenslandica TaxID=400682 RepID=A0AAN0JM60_AMPQE
WFGLARRYHSFVFGVAAHKTGRELKRDHGQSERQEKQLTATVLAKQLVELRQQKTKSYGLSATITATGHQMKAMQSQVAMTKAMGQTSKAMASMNKQVKLEDIQQTMQQFEKESTKMDMAGEMMDDTMDAILSGDEDEEDEVIGQVLDEIGLEYTSKLAGAKVAGGKLGQEDKELTSTDDLEARLANLHAS